MNCKCCFHPGTLHEIWFGNGWRRLSIIYSLQIPLCPGCHDEAHGRGKNKGYQYKSKIEMMKIYCGLMGIDYEKTDWAIKKHHEIVSYGRLGTMTSKEFLMFQSKRIKEQLKEWE